LWKNVLCVKYGFIHDSGDLEAILRVGLELDNWQYTGKEKERPMCRYVMFGKEVRRHAGGSAVTIRKLSTELERIRALREVYGIDIPDEAQAHILGRDSAFQE
jgi:hypothetical protein